MNIILQANQYNVDHNFSLYFAVAQTAEEQRSKGKIVIQQSEIHLVELEIKLSCWAFETY